MKKYFYILLLLSLLVSCGTKNTEDSINNQAENVEEHDHDHDDHSADDVIIIEPEVAAKLGVKSESIKKGSFQQVIKTAGQIQAAQGEERTVASTMSGIVSFNAKPLTSGAGIKQGEVLVTISASNLADGDPVRRAESSFNAADAEYTRAKALIEDKLISQKDFNDIKMRYEQAKLSFEALAKNRNSKGVNLTAPMSGYIKNLLVEDGQFVNIGDPLLVVTKNNKMQLKADLSQREFANLHNIKSANFITPYDKKLYQLDNLNGKLLSYGKNTDATSLYLPIIFQFDNVGDVISGSFVEVYLLGKEKENIISIPLTALTDEQGLFFVYVKHGSEEYVRTFVTLGESNGEKVEILSGLKEGDELVTEGAYQVKLSKQSGEIPHGHSH